MPRKSNRDLLLDAAEVLFAERGVGRVSLRSIQTAAGLSVGSIQYHFDGEADLVCEVLSRRTTPLNAQRMKALRRLRKSTQPTTRKLMDALLAPLVQSFAAKPGTALLHVKIVQRMQADHLTNSSALKSQTPEIHELVSALLCAILPNMPVETIEIRLEMAWDTIVSSIARWEGDDDPDFSRFAVTLAEFLAGALEAPASAVCPSPTKHRAAQVMIQPVAP